LPVARDGNTGGENIRMDVITISNIRESKESGPAEMRIENGGAALGPKPKDRVLLNIGAVIKKADFGGNRPRLGSSHRDLTKDDL